METRLKSVFGTESFVEFGSQLGVCFSVVLDKRKRIGKWVLLHWHELLLLGRIEIVFLIKGHGHIVVKVSHLIVDHFFLLLKPHMVQVNSLLHLRQTILGRSLVDVWLHHNARLSLMRRREVALNVETFLQFVLRLVLYHSQLWTAFVAVPMVVEVALVDHFFCPGIAFNYCLLDLARLLAIIHVSKVKLTLILLGQRALHEVGSDLWSG